MLTLRSSLQCVMLKRGNPPSARTNGSAVLVICLGCCGWWSRIGPKMGLGILLCLSGDGKSTSCGLVLWVIRIERANVLCSGGTLREFYYCSGEGQISRFLHASNPSFIYLIYHDQSHPRALYTETSNLENWGKTILKQGTSSTKFPKSTSNKFSRAQR